MAELRRAEEKVQNLRLAYTELRRQYHDGGGYDGDDGRHDDSAWPALTARQEETDGGDAAAAAAVTKDATTSWPPSPCRRPNLAATKALRQLDSIRDQMRADLRELVVKFEKRLVETDPVTGKARYGEKTQQRVAKLLSSYHELNGILQYLYGEPITSSSTTTSTAEEEEESNGANAATRPKSEALDLLKKQAALEQQQELETQRRREQAQAQAAAAAQREQEARLEAERQAAAQIQAEQRRRRELVEQEAQRAMQQARHAAAEAARADREWQASIEKGARGVRTQLQRLLDATAHDGAAQRTAVAALHTIFGQIVSRPEEDNLRRIRRNHAQFEQDIGRHAGGKEVLIAAGFRVGAIDEVPCYICSEPNLETDMDGWANWFDLLKETLAIIEEFMIKTM